MKQERRGKNTIARREIKAEERIGRQMNSVRKKKKKKS